MTSEPIKVLLVEDNPGNIRLIRDMLKEAKPALAALEDAPSLLTAVERLAKGESTRCYWIWGSRTARASALLWSYTINSPALPS